MQRGDIHNLVNVGCLVGIEAVAVGFFWRCVTLPLPPKLGGALILLLALMFPVHRLVPRMTGPVIERIFRNLDG